MTYAGRPLLTLLGRNRRGDAVEGRALGWSGNSALVALPRSACGASGEGPGVYAFDTHGKARLLFRLPKSRLAAAHRWR